MSVWQREQVDHDTVRHTRGVEKVGVLSLRSEGLWEHRVVNFRSGDAGETFDALGDALVAAEKSHGSASGMLGGSHR